MANQRTGSPGDVIRELRSLRGLSQSEFAARLSDVSPTGRVWSQSTIARIETGAKALRLDEGAEIAAALGVEIAEIAAGDLSVVERQERFAAVENILIDVAQSARALAAAADRLEDQDVSAAEVESYIQARGEAWANYVGFAGDRDAQTSIRRAEKAIWEHVLGIRWTGARA